MKPVTAQEIAAALKRHEYPTRRCRSSPRRANRIADELAPAGNQVPKQTFAMPWTCCDGTATSTTCA
mgnify:CR=1 FL=1